MFGVGQRIGNYRVLRKLGQGGMGAVYEAIHEEIGRRAAIKILLPEYATDRQSIARFFNEARAVNIIDHPSFVEVYESGRLDDGAAYIVMEYLAGELLSTRLEKGIRLPHQDAINTARQIASALRAAHEKGIVHRDLKPDNVMIVVDPEMPDGERVKVFDFGIAKLRLHSLGGGAAVGMATQSGVIMGTPTHMAPEQCRGMTDVDGKADVYALGVILFEMLIGHPPFLADSAGELMSMHLRDKPPSLRKLDPSVPDELADLVHEMLAKEPDARPRMADVVSTLEELGAYRTRRIAPVRAAGSSGTQDRPRAPFLTLQQAFGQTFQSQQAKRFTIAIGLAVLLVLASAVLLFHDGTPNPASNPPVTDQVSWTIESAPPGAAILSADSGELLARTPWQRAAPRESGQLRVELRLEGYESTTVVLSRSQSIQQKILLSPIAQPRREASPLPTGQSEPGSDHAQPQGKSEQPQTLIRCDLSSRPRGATVIRSEDGKELGTTPLKLDAQVPGKQLKVTLKLAGYQDASVILDKDTSARQIIALSRKKK